MYPHQTSFPHHISDLKLWDYLEKEVEAFLLVNLCAALEIEITFRRSLEDEGNEVTDKQYPALAIQWSLYYLPLVFQCVSSTYQKCKFLR